MGAQAGGQGTDGFAETRWSLVADAGQSGAQLTELCVQYWYPLYAYVRRQGHAPERAQQITSAFLNQLVSERLASLRDEPPPRFREWLQQELTRFMAGAWRPGGREIRGLESPAPVGDLEARYRAEGQAAGDPGRDFSRSFALEVLNRGANRLRQEARQAGREPMFALMSSYLTREPAPEQFEAWSQQLGLRPLALLTALKRLRQRYRELVEDELAQTVRAPADLEAERQALHAALRGGP